MEILEDGILAFLAAVGITTLVWLFASLFTRTKAGLDAYILVPARGGGENLACTVHQLEEIRLQVGRRAKILVADCGLTPEGRHIAELLCGEDTAAVLCTPEELKKMLR